MVNPSDPTLIPNPPHHGGFAVRPRHWRIRSSCSATFRRAQVPTPVRRLPRSRRRCQIFLAGPRDGVDHGHEPRTRHITRSALPFVRDGVDDPGDHLGDARVREVPGAGHFGVAVDPEAVAEALTRFLAEASAART